MSDAQAASLLDKGPDPGPGCLLGQQPGELLTPYCAGPCGVSLADCDGSAHSLAAVQHLCFHLCLWAMATAAARPCT